MATKDCMIRLQMKHVEKINHLFNNKFVPSPHDVVNKALDEYFDPKTKLAKRLFEMAKLEVLKELDSTAKI